LKLVKNGVDEKHRIIGAEAPTPFLYNLSLEVIERFREQVEPINLISDEDVLLGTDPRNIRAAVLACRSKEKVRFLDHILHDKGAYDKPAICSKITLRIKEPWKYQTTSEEADIIERIKKAAQARSTGKQ
jgi:tetrahydromethanopterin S-methyltransferase subunit A